MIYGWLTYFLFYPPRFLHIRVLTHGPFLAWCFAIYLLYSYESAVNFAMYRSIIFFSTVCHFLHRRCVSFRCNTALVGKADLLPVSRCVPLCVSRRYRIHILPSMYYIECFCFQYMCYFARYVDIIRSRLNTLLWLVGQYPHASSFRW